MVGELIGEGAAQEEAVVGETPNLAARLQALAEPGSVVDQPGDTRRLLGGLFELTDLGPRRLKGFAEPLAAWRVEGEGRAEGRFEALHGEQLTPLVGREHELGILLERWGWAKDGDGQVVLHCRASPASASRAWSGRCASELERRAARPLSHYCSPHHTNSALYPMIDAAGAGRCASSRDDLPEAQARQAGGDARPRAHANRLDEAVPLLAALLGVPVGERYPALNLSPERQKQRTLRGPGRSAGRPRAVRSRCLSSTRTCTGLTRRRWSCWTC